LGESQPSK